MCAYTGLTLECRSMLSECGGKTSDCWLEGRLGRGELDAGEVTRWGYIGLMCVWSTMEGDVVGLRL